MSWIAFALPTPRSDAAGKGPPLQDSATFGNYVARTYFDPDSNAKDAYFEILQGNKQVYRKKATENGERFVIGTLYKDDPDAKLVAMGRDITGGGRPDLVISEWTGGANCCLTFHIFEIGATPRQSRAPTEHRAATNPTPHLATPSALPFLEDWLLERGGLETSVSRETFAKETPASIGEISC